MHKETFLVCYYTRALQNAAFNSADLGLVLMTKKRVLKIKILCTLNKSKYELQQGFSSFFAQMFGMFGYFWKFEYLFHH